MKIPPTYVVFRVAAAAICVLMLLLFGLGLARSGPFSQFGNVVSPASRWLHIHVNPGVPS